MKQHSTSIVDPKADIAEDVEIGPFCIVHAGARIGSGSRLISHVVIHGCVDAGQENSFHQGCSIGDQPQDFSYKGEETTVRIGNNNVFREFFSVHRGTFKDKRETVIGDKNYFMAHSHVAHDCIVGSNVTFANCGNLAGHTIVDDFATVGAFCGVHQHCRVGLHAFMGASTIATKDIMPFALVVAGAGNRAQVFGPNAVGLKRKGYSPEAIINIRRVYKLICNSGLNTTQALDKISDELEATEEVNLIVDFIKSSKRGVVK